MSKDFEVRQPIIIVRCKLRSRKKACSCYVRAPLWERC